MQLKNKQFQSAFILFCEGFPGKTLLNTENEQAEALESPHTLFLLFADERNKHNLKLSSRYSDADKKNERTLKGEGKECNPV